MKPLGRLAGAPELLDAQFNTAMAGGSRGAKEMLTNWPGLIILGLQDNISSTTATRCYLDALQQVSATSGLVEIILSLLFTH